MPMGSSPHCCPVSRRSEVADLRLLGAPQLAAVDANRAGMDHVAFTFASLEILIANYRSGTPTADLLTRPES